MAYKKSFKAQPMFDTVSVVAAAILAYRTNGQIEKADLKVNDLRLTGDEWLPTPVVVKSNKTMVTEFLEHPELLTQELLDEAKAQILAVQGQLTLAVLTGKKVSDFVRDLAVVIENDQIQQYRIGLVVYVPNVYKTIQAKEKIAETINENLYTSIALGAPGQKLAVNFTLIEKRYIQSINCFSAFGKDENGNFVQFLTPHEDRCVTGKLSGKVKAVGNDKWHNNAMVTNLNFVKVVA